MADTITQTEVVQITLMDSSGNKQSFNIDNPKSNISMTGIKNALAPAIASGYWYSKAGSPFIAVNAATVTQSKKIKLDNSEVEITVTPSSVEFASGQSGSVQTKTVVVEGANLLGAYISQISNSALVTALYANVSEQTVTVKGQFTGSYIHFTALLNIVTDIKTVSIPISITST